MTEQMEQMIFNEGYRRGKADRHMILGDGTLVISVSDATAVTRVLVEDSEKNGDLYYADRPQWEVDAIDRDALIDYCLKLIDVERKQGSDVMNYGQERVNQTEAIIDYIEHMPHVTADRPKGEWREERNWRTASFYSVCSECGYFDDERDDLTAYNFCPQCGAEMKGADDE